MNCCGIPLHLDSGVTLSAIYSSLSPSPSCPTNPCVPSSTWASGLWSEEAGRIVALRHSAISKSKSSCRHGVSTQHIVGSKRRPSRYPSPPAAFSGSSFGGLHAPECNVYSASQFVNAFRTAPWPVGIAELESRLRKKKSSAGGAERGPVVCGATAAAATAAAGERVAAAEEFTAWLKEQGFPDQALAVRMIGDEGLGLAALQPLKVGEVALTVPENFCVTAFDIASHPVISSAASGRGDLIALTLWLMYEKAQGKASAWYPFLRLFPEATLSPLLWTVEELDEQLRGSSVLVEVRQRLAVLEEEYEYLKTSYFDKDTEVYLEEAFSWTAFKNAFAVIMSRAFYLPSVNIFALVPFGDCVNHRGEVTTYLDYSSADQAVVLKVDRDYKAGQQVFVTYGEERSNSDLLISYGFVDIYNTSNYLETEVQLLPVDRLKVLKQQIIEQAGFGDPQMFPLFENRFPAQLLTYMRLSRLTDVGLFAKISFDRDVIVDQANEYEILMLLMGDCRVRLQGYSGSTDDETRIANDRDCSPKEKVAAQLRLMEKKILINTMSALRNRLAPIRGIPVKGGGLKDPNSDLLEMFDMAEQVASAPAKFFAKIFKK